jgi:transposase
MTERTILSVDYHDQNCVLRRYDGHTGAEAVQAVPTDRTALLRAVEQARGGQGGELIWLQESTTGWARVKDLVGPHVSAFVLANVLQLPKRPKDHRKKTDRLDTQRVLHEYLLGRLVEAWQPEPLWRQARRVVAWREDLVNRRTALRNWLNRYLAHETWIDRTGLWSAKGQARWRELLPALPELDQVVVAGKLEELQHLQGQLRQALRQLLALYHRWPAAQRLDAIKGISVIAAVSIVARVGSIERFQNAEALIA